MANSKTTKKALLSSALALTMCVAMLIATTFAWFTDTASTSVNKIQAGTLKVGLEMLTQDEGENTETWKDAEGQTLSFKKASTASGTDVLWEPGCTYELPAIRVVNKGNLALKYIISVTGVDGDSELLDAIEFKVKVGDETAIPLAKLSGILLPEGKGATAKTEEKVQYSGTIVISGHMKEAAGNNYQTKSIDGIGITVHATQYTYEYDSYNNTYDKVDLWDGTVATTEELTAVTSEENHTVTVGSAKLLAAIAEKVNSGNGYENYTITLENDIDLAGISWTPIGSTTDTAFKGTFDGNNKTISNLTLSAADGVKDVGLIGYAKHATIKNLTVSDAKISDVGRLGVILGKGEQKNTIQNCTVKDSTITARTWWNPKAKDGKGNWDDGDKAGAIAGYLCEGGNVVTGCTVENCTIKGYRDIGGLIGRIGSVSYGTDYNDSVTCNTVSNTTITCDKTHDYQEYGDESASYNVNKFVGKVENATYTTVSNNAEENVTLN